jgi:hypothetical protein
MGRLAQQKNELIELTPEQEHPAQALAQDFEVGTPADNAASKVPGCYGDLSQADYDAVCRESDELSHAKKTSGQENSPVNP